MSNRSKKLSDLGIVQPRGFPSLPEGWVADGITLLSANGKTKLFALLLKKLQISAKPARVLLVLHGLGEHGGRYAHLPHYLQDACDVVFCLDHRGHGRSEGTRGHVERFDEMADDAARVFEYLRAMLQKEVSGGGEIHVLGHSLGGHVALRMAFLNSNLPIASMTITAPFLGIKANVSIAKRLAAQGLAHLWGSLQLDTALDVKALSHDPAVEEAYLSDRLVHRKMTPRFFVELTNAFQDTLRRDSGMVPPLQMLVPLQDRLVDAEKALQFFHRLKHTDKRLRTLPDFFHEPVNEVGKEKVFEEIRSWMALHPSAKPRSAR